MAAALAVPFVFAVLLLIEGVGLLIWAFRGQPGLSLRPPACS
jgi:hypothetical protein